MPAQAGYSGKPLFQKLGMKPGMRCLAIAAPDHYDQLIDGAEDMDWSKDGAADLVHLFCPDQQALNQGMAAALDRVAQGGMLWISWPKKSSKLFIDLTEDDLRRCLLPLGWVDVKVCAVDQTWSGLKFLRRRTG